MANIWNSQELLPLMMKASECLETACEPMNLSKAVIVNITSGYGSTYNNVEGKYYYSRCCRVSDCHKLYETNYLRLDALDIFTIQQASLNSATKNLAIDLKEKGIIVVGISPGLVQTEQFGAMSPPSVEESAAGVVRILQSLDETKSGLFLDFAGYPIPW